MRGFHQQVFSTRARRAIVVVLVLLATWSTHAQGRRDPTTFGSHLHTLDAPLLPQVLEAAGLPATLDRQRAVLELVRVVHRAPADQDPSAATAQLRITTVLHGPPTLSPSGRPTTSALLTLSSARLAPPTATFQASDYVQVPSPVPARVWRDLLARPGRELDDRGIFTALIADRQASLLYHGLFALDDETLTFLIKERGTLKAIYERGAAAFSVFAPGIRVRNGRLELPGGPSAASLWAGLAPELALPAERALPLVFERDGGRLAYFLQVAHDLDETRLSLLLGPATGAEADRIARFKGTYAQVLRSERAWEPSVRPFGRASLDLQQLLATIDVSPGGEPTGPMWPWLWASVFDGRDARPSPTGASARVSAEWLAGLLDLDRAARRERLETMLFAQRTFGEADERTAATLVPVFRAFGRYRALFLALDRMNVRDPRVYLAALERVSGLAAREDEPSAVETVLFQAGLTFVERARFGRGITVETASRLVSALVAARPTGHGRFAEAFVEWLRRDLLAERRPAPTAPATPSPAVVQLGARVPSAGDSAATVEDALLAFVAGADATRTFERVDYEGNEYEVDPAGAELSRMRRIRDRQGDQRLDDVLEVMDALAEWRRPDDERTGANVAKRIEAMLERARRSWQSAERLSTHTDILLRSLADATRAMREQGQRPGPPSARTVDAVERFAERALADVALAIVYATALGDPDGAVVVGGDVWRRHQLTVAGVEAESRHVGPWTPPVESVGTGRAWRVLGSLIGLDLALARLSLRRLDGEYPPQAPLLSGFDRVALMHGAVLMPALDLTNVDRDRIADAVARGTARVGRLRDDPAEVEAVVAALALDGWQERVLRWTLAHEPEFVDLFSLTDLYWLGRDGASVGVAWGTSGLPASGCLCQALPVPRPLSGVIGRPGTGLVATRFGDLPILAALTLKDFDLPAPLARGLVVLLTQTTLDAARPVHGDDLIAFSRAIRGLTRNQMEDYVAALTYDGALRPVRAGSPDAVEEPR
ncbi:MAG: hypothetical protein U0Q12_11425 [Vicinamibacterales bacterium]